MNQNEQMKPDQALKLLDNVAAQVQLSRADHVAIQQAIQVLGDLIDSKATEKVGK